MEASVGDRNSACSKNREDHTAMKLMLSLPVGCTSILFISTSQFCEAGNISSVSGLQKPVHTTRGCLSSGDLPGSMVVESPFIIWTATGACDVKLVSMVFPLVSKCLKSMAVEPPL